MFPAKFGEAYAVARPELDSLRQRVDGNLAAIATELKGEAFSRVKAADSIFEKLLPGGWPSFRAMDDLVAATLVLPQQPSDAVKLQIEAALEQRFEVLKTISARTKRPSEFVYDDLHYSLRLRDDALLLDKTLRSWKVELQVKSFLQHGWSKSTHDLVYKAPEESWQLSRVAAQTRAMIEVADNALTHATTSGSFASVLPNKAIDDRRALTAAVQDWWGGELPEDRRRLGVFVVDTLKLAHLKVPDFLALLEGERGLELARKVPIASQQAILILAIEHDPAGVFKRAASTGKFLAITSEMEDISPECRLAPSEVRVDFG